MARLPYAPREGQERLVEAVASAQEQGRHLLAEAGTGTGKTVAALAASLESAKAQRRRLMWATRTNSQQTMVLREHRALVEAGLTEALLVPFMGRRQYCPHLMADPRYRDGSSEELGRLCSDAKRQTRKEVATGSPCAGSCPFYARLLEDGPGPVAALLRAGVTDAAELADRVSAAGSCPYEALKALLPEADAVVLPSVFLVDDRLRRGMLDWLGVGADECLLVVDEAHHLPAAARDHHSPRLTLVALQRALKEAEEYKDPVLAGTVLTTTVLDALIRVLYALVDEYAREQEDGLLPPGALEEALLQELRMPTPQLHRVAAEMEQCGQVIREDRRGRGRLPRSYLGSVGAFLAFWRLQHEAPYVHLVVAGERPALEACLLDPAAVLAWLDEFWSTVHMSGTLAPLEEHQALCGLSARVAHQVLPAPFPPEHLHLYGIQGLQRGHDALQRDPGLIARQQDAARHLLRSWTGRIGLFFPSHQMAADFLEEGFLHGIDATVHVERPGMTASELERLVGAFRRDAGPRVLLVGVLGGRITEGLDFPGDAMEHLLVFGVPYPRPTARQQALVHYHDRKHGAGWQYAVHGPTGRVLRQAIGRLIRGPEDRGTAVVLDDRVVRFRTVLPRLWMVEGPEDVLGPPPQEHDGFVEADRYGRAAQGTGSAVGVAPEGGAEAFRRGGAVL